MKNRVSAVSALALSWMMAGTFASEAQAQGAPAPTPAPTAAGGSRAQATAATTGQAAAPQSRPPAAASDDPMADEEEVVVVGQRPFGSVNSDIKPEQTLNAGDVRSYGVSSVAELLTELAPQTNAAAGPPVVLLNGKRISGFQEIRDLPPEAIQRVEILPEDVSLAYGYAANQKVVNIVLRRRFNAWTGEIGAGTTTEGGRESGRATANLLQIRGTTRMSLDVTYSAADELRESERDIIPATPSRPFALSGNVGSAPGATQIDPALSALAGQTVTVAAVPASATSGRPALAAFVPGANAAIVDDLGRYRTLSPATDNLAINAVIARPLSEKVQGSFNARLEFSGSDSLQGLPGLTLLLPAGNPFSPFSGATQVYRYSAADGGLAQSSRSTDLHVGGALNGEIKDWQWTFTTAYDRTSSRSTSERGIDTTALQAALLANDPTVNPFGVLPPQLLTATLTDRARSTTSSLSGDFLLSGSPFRLPAGKATTSITISGASNDFSSRSQRSGVARALDYSRDIGGVKASIDLPITSRRSGFGAAIGDFALNGNAEVQHLSDYGRITTIGYGLRWSPITEIRFIASMTHDTAAPNGQQVNNPLLTTPNVPVFDYRTGTTVFVTQLSGGNPALLASERQRLRLSLTAKPFTDKDLTLTALFTDNRTDNPVGSFPIPTPQVEAAFPGRFTRDAFGTLVQVDTRPVNYVSSRSTSLRYGFNFSVPLKSALQKKVEAWRAAGANPEDRPKELDAMRELFMRERERREGQRGQGGQGGNRGGEQANAQGGSTSDNAPPASEDQARRPDGAPATDRGPGEGGGFRGGGGGFGGGGGGRGGFGGGGGFGGRGGGGGGGRMQFALFHTIHLNEDIRIAPGLPKLDLLDGAAIGNSGGQSRHEVEAQAGYTNNGLGARLSANWRSATRVDGALGTANSTLKFGDLATADLRLFVNFTQMPELIRDYPFLRGSRLTLAVTNILNSKQDVRDASGAVPISYLPDRIDPLGRRVMVSFRKLFF